jgi:hypothetical protein
MKPVTGAVSVSVTKSIRKNHSGVKEIFIFPCNATLKVDKMTIEEVLKRNMRAFVLLDDTVLDFHKQDTLHRLINAVHS